MKIKKLAVIASIAIAFSGNVMAESLVEQIKKRAGAISEVKTLLNDPDQNVRLAALDVMLKSNDTAMRELAYTTGFNSADDTFRAVTLRNKLNETDLLALTLTLPENASEKIQKTFAYYGGILSLQFKDYDEKNGKFTTASTRNPGYKKAGNLSGLSLTFATSYCGGTLVLNEESELAGTITCDGHLFPAKANII
ncbi:hypothetical protein [Pseudoalteromonas sp. G4]|uniref:hypothetical protein n=1 Tax=Pseudoalteromonas sp. G4 TaxID=2992761 RepID=UPI00237DF541|nr:hypothetical protein [Pseudoalteromonas sp. G4]MDE3271393.1 hypothetical protein [Pseudoalteromonas sp. G4]